MQLRRNLLPTSSPLARTARGLLALSALALGVTLMQPEALGFVKNGAFLTVPDRHGRLFNNFDDPGANNNVRGFPEFPGALGAEQAFWKGMAEWNSVARGGDPTQAELGNGGANFDSSYQGNATDVGGVLDNVASAFGGCPGGVVAFTEMTGSAGWRMRFCDNFIWADGPANIGPNIFDIQSSATSGYGRALGLGNSMVPGATMSPIAEFGVSQRSIEADDIAGLQCIYGIADPMKPVITAIAFDAQQQMLTITGTNFDASGNEVWFAREGASDPALDPRVIVSGLASTNGGTEIQVGVPAEAGPGDVLVLRSAGGSEDLSNPFPTDLGVPFFGAATFFNGTGVNPSCFTSNNLPQLDRNWMTTIDASGHPGGAGFSGMFVYAGSGSVILPSGELLVDLGSTQLAVVAVPSSGGLDNLNLALPDLPQFYGRTAFAQGFTFSLGTGIRWCNAYELTLGAHP